LWVFFTAFRGFSRQFRCEPLAAHPRVIAQAARVGSALRAILLELHHATARHEVGVCREVALAIIEIGDLALVPPALFVLLALLAGFQSLAGFDAFVHFFERFGGFLRN